MKRSFKKQQQRAYNKGLTYEREFCKITGAVKGTQQDDYDHIDVRLGGKTYDVKGLKKAQRNGHVLVELRNVQGKAGWCSRKGADKIAFRFPEGYLVVDTLELLSVTNSLVARKGGTASVERRSGIPYSYTYRLIGRKNRKDVFVYLKKEDIMPIVEKVYEIN